jgi:pimeloyl-ACP methyl ester carboxylesterase
MPFITHDDETRIYYTDWGSGPPVVLIHGWPANGDMWDRQSTFLAEHGLRAIAYDRRGFGSSSQTWQGYDYNTFAADLHSLMEHLDLRDATLVGFSMGGGEVARYLATYGEKRVSKAVLVAAITPFLLKTGDNPAGIDAAVFEDIERKIREDRPAFLRDFGARFYGRTLISHGVSDAVLDWTQSMCYTGSLRSTLAAAKAWSTTDFRDDLRRITIPVRLIHGTDDKIVPIENSALEAIKLLQNASLTEYEGAPHGLFITAADRLNQELLSFVTGQDDATMTPGAVLAAEHETFIPALGGGLP